MTRFTSLLVLALGLVALDATMPATKASAQEVEITGPLAGQPAVRRMRLYRQGRIQLEPNFSFTLQDEYARSLIAGLHAGYYFTDWIGIGLWFGYAVANLDTNLTEQVEAQGVTTDRNRLSLPCRATGVGGAGCENAPGFSGQIGQRQWMGALQLEFIPLRGKLAMFQKLFVDTDFYIFLGAAMVGVEERADIDPRTDCAGVDDVTCISNSQGARATRVIPTFTFGAGLSMFFNDFIGLNLNWRGIPYAWNTSGTDESGSEDGDFPDGRINDQDRFYKFTHMFTIGLTIYLPTEPDITD